MNPHVGNNDPNAVSGLETWTVRKPAIESKGGLVASQHYRAADVGAQILRAGGNAVDAAVAASFTLATVEPWMSGLGGGGFMLIYMAAEARVHAIDFSMVAPQGLDPADYPLVGGVGGDLFSWPSVVEDRNIRGPHSMAVPGQVAGMALALETFGTKSWAEAIAPAIEMAHQGLEMDWYATLKVASAAKALSGFAESKRIFLPNGFPPVGEWGGPLPRIRLGCLPQTLEQLAKAGPGDFYEGELARAIVADAQTLGSKLSVADLQNYRAFTSTPGTVNYRSATVYTAPGLSAGPTLLQALRMLDVELQPGARPDPQAFGAYAKCLQQAYKERLATMGDANEADSPSCTTHLSVVDRHGNIVALTQTLLSIFGSKTMLPKTGIMMNNGIMWFDPRPNRSNSIIPGKRPLANMCPTIVNRGDGCWFALGGSGGRRIMPAVFQLISFLVDHDMGVDAAMHHGRIDVSGGDVVSVDSALPGEIIAALSRTFEAHSAQHGVYPALFACPELIGCDTNTGINVGGAYVLSPVAKVSAE